MLSFKMGELSVEPGTSVLKEKSNSPHLYTVLEGWCFRYRTLVDGSRQLLNFALPGDMIGLQTSMFGEIDHSVDALTNLTLCVFSRERIWELYQNHPSLAFDVTWLATREERILGEYLTAVGQRTAMSRLAFVLLQLYRRCEPINLARNNRMPVPFTQQHLADLTREVLVVGRQLRGHRDDQRLRQLGCGRRADPVGRGPGPARRVDAPDRAVRCAHQRDEIASERHVVRIHHREHRCGDDGCVDSVATRPICAHSGLGRQRMRCGERPGERRRR